MSFHWGEIRSAEPDTGITAVEREQLIKPKHLDVDPPAVHQPSSRHFPPVNEAYKPDAFQLDSVSLHTIRLIRHARQIRSLIHTANVQLQDLKHSDCPDPPNFAPGPSLPEYTGRQMLYQKNKDPIAFLPKNMDSDFIKGIMKPPPEIDHRTNRRLLRKSVAAICAHTGFESCGESVLETMTDIGQEYMLQLTRLLRRAVDNDLMNGPSGFPDPIEQVFHEMGIGSMTTLHDFYQSRVINYHENMMKTCQQLNADYERITHPDHKLQEDIKPQKLKEEPMSDISFPNMDESEDGADNEHNLNLESLGLDIHMPQESNESLSQEEDGKWQCSTKSEPSEKYGSLDSYDPDDGNSSASEVARTPALSEAGDSVKDPASVPMADMMSPPSGSSISIRTPSGKPPKKKKKK